MGYYDAGGRWIASDQGPTSAQPGPMLDQIMRLEAYARSPNGKSAVGNGNARSALRELSAIRKSESRLRRDRDGNLSIGDEATLQLRVDRVRSRLGMGSSQ